MNDPRATDPLTPEPDAEGKEPLTPPEHGWYGIMVGEPTNLTFENNTFEPWSPDAHIPSPESPEIARLRQQNHDHAARRDREMAALQSEVDRWHNAAARARELVRGTPVDWTNDPPSQKPDGWWHYQSQQVREILTTAVLDLQGGAAERGFTSGDREGKMNEADGTAELRETPNGQRSDLGPA